MNDNDLANYAQQKASESSGGTQETPKETTQQSQPQENNSEKKVDNDVKNSYIPDRNVDTSNSGDEESAKYERLLNEKFGGDPTKLAKSYLHSQKEFQKTQSSLKEYENNLKQYDELINSDPMLKDILQARRNGMSVERYLQEKQPPQRQTESNVSDSKLDTDFLSVDENQLSKEGLLDLSGKSDHTPTSWNNEVMKARLLYASKVLPQKTYEQTISKIEQYNKEQQAKTEQQRLQQENRKRFDVSFESALLNGWDFTGDHKDVLEEATNQARYIIDPKNPKLIAPDAFEIALNRIASQRGIQVKQSKPLPQQQRSVNYDTQNYKSGKVEHQELSMLEKARLKLMDTNSAKQKRHQSLRKFGN